MSATYSSIKAMSEPDVMATFLADEVINPVLPAVAVKKVRATSGRRFEAPRVLWGNGDSSAGLDQSVLQ